MNSGIKTLLIFGCSLAFGWLGLPPSARARSANLNLSINVSVFNYAELSPNTLQQAEAVAAEILGKAGVEITWTNCDPTRRDLGDPAECGQVLGSSNLGVRILPDFGATPGITKGTMGFAMGDLASISFRRVTHEAREFGVQPCEVLGPAIAHELGHLLLGQPGHSPTGIMRARWRREDYERAPRGAFDFTAEQAEQIRAKMNPGIDVYVFNYAELSPKTLQRAEAVAAHIFREAGIEAIWRNCDSKLTDINQDVNCKLARPADFMLKILPDIAVTPGLTHDTTMGFAIGAFASVSFRQVRKEAALMGATPEEILGLTAAHEIGHLLSQSHSDRGIMRPSWRREDFGVSPQGAFEFTPEQAQQIRTEVSTRNRVQQANALPESAAQK